MQIRRTEVATGLLVLVTFAILIGVLVVIGMPGIIRPLNTYRIYFDNAAGIRKSAPVLVAGREVGQVSALSSPVPPPERPAGHPDYEVLIEVQVDRGTTVYRDSVVRLKQQGLMGQEVIDFVGGTEAGGVVEDQAEFVGVRTPDFTEAFTGELEHLTGKDSDLARALRNAAEMTETLKRQPWRLIWPSTKKEPEEKKKK